MKTNWKQFFLNSLKRGKAKAEALDTGQSGGAIEQRPVQIISPTAQATNQARESAKEGAYGDITMQSNTRSLKQSPGNMRQRKRRVTKKKKAPSKRRRKTTSSHRRYKRR